MTPIRLVSCPLIKRKLWSFQSHWRLVNVLLKSVLSASVVLLYIVECRWWWHTCNAIVWRCVRSNTANRRRAELRRRLQIAFLSDYVARWYFAHTHRQTVAVNVYRETCLQICTYWAALRRKSLACFRNRQTIKRPIFAVLQGGCHRFKIVVKRC